MNYADYSLEDADYLLLHQANKFMLDKITKKLNFNSRKVPLSLRNFGNTSSASIPLTIVTNLKDDLSSSRKSVVVSGFGVGLSWASGLLTLDNLTIPTLEEI